MLSAKLHRKRLRIHVWIDVQMNNFWNTQSNFTLKSLITLEVLNQTFSNLQGTCRNSSRCCPVFHVILQAPSPGITATSLLIWQSVIKYFTRYSFRRQFRRQFSTVFHVILQAPLPGITATSLLIWRSLIKYFKSYSFRRQFRRQFSTVFHVILQATSTAITATSL